MHALSPAAPKDGALSSRAAKRHRGFPYARQQQAEAFSSNDVLLFGLRAHTQNSNGFVVAGDAFSDEPYAIPLRKDIAPFLGLIDHDVGRCSMKGGSTGSSVFGSRTPLLASSPEQDSGT